jgi:hypothetical protein
LLQGLIIAKEEGIRTLIELGDFMLVIKEMIDQDKIGGGTELSHP